MKTHEIMKKYWYESNGGPIDAVPVSDVIKFCKRIQNMLEDDNYSRLKQEIDDVLTLLLTK